MKKIYFENLDSLRFLSFLSVFLFHSFHTTIDEIKNDSVYIFINDFLVKNGNLGVNFFFVLSGFLITYFLIIEKNKNKINIKKFWARRILRIWPLFYACLLIGFIGFPVLKQLLNQESNETANLIYYLTFTNNFDLIKNGLPDASILGVLWSIAIEEQFYLVWPLILSLFPVKKYWIPFLIIILSSLAFRYSNPTYIYHEFHTLSCINDMTVGSIGAWLIITNEKFLQRITNLNKTTITSLYILVIILFFFRSNIIDINPLIKLTERFFISCVFIIVILEQNYSNKSIYKLGRIKLFSKLGKLTYGLYCLHFIGILISINITKLLQFNTEVWQVLFLETTLALFITIVISKISYRFFEVPFLKLKDKFYS